MRLPSVVLEELPSRIEMGTGKKESYRMVPAVNSRRNWI
jgi:hypothetical protein